MRSLLRYIVRKTWKPYLEKRLSKPQQYRYKKIKLTISPGVFHPAYFYSTKFLLKYILRLELRNKNILELGCGSGLISIAAAKRGALVTSSDISLTAVQALPNNAKLNSAKLTIIHSDLFAMIPDQQFDLIFINPPYYRGKPLTEKDHAWYSGEENEYFTRLFSDVKRFMNKNSKIIMVLSENCEIEFISECCDKNGLVMEMERKKNFFLETEMIFHIFPNKI